MNSNINLRFVSPFGNKRLLLAFGAIAVLSAGFTGWVSAGILQRNFAKLTNPFDERTTSGVARCAFGSAAGFLLVFIPAIIAGESGASLPLPITILAASTILGGFVASRPRDSPAEDLSPDDYRAR